MQVKIHRIDPDLPLPKYETSGACAFDFLARERIEIAPRATALVPGNVVVQTPPGFALLVLPRSSLFRKKSLIFPHSIGLIDRDFCGAGDEIQIQLLNFSEKPVAIERGERLAQGIFIRTENAKFLETPPTAPTRGGFGSTDNRKSK